MPNIKARSSSSGYKSKEFDTKRSGPSDGIKRWNPKTVWWHAPWKRSGKTSSKNSRPPKPNWPARNTSNASKELLQTLLEDVTINLLGDAGNARLILRWKTGAVSELEVQWKTPRVAPIRTEEDTVELIRRLAVHHTDAVIAGVLNRQGKHTATGERFTANRVGNVRRHWKIPVYKAPSIPPKGELLTVQGAADKLGVAASTLHRWLMDGFIAGEQVTPGAPWRIRMTKELQELFVTEAPEGYVPMFEAMRRLGVSRQTVMQRVKRGELPAVHVRRGKQKGLRIRVLDDHPQLFE
jgi:hypothetical protein